MVTDNLPDGKFLQPRLAVFALYFVQTHTSLRLSNTPKSQSTWLFNLRRERDLNPRWVLPHATLAVWCFQPLSHLSSYTNYYILFFRIYQYRLSIFEFMTKTIDKKIIYVILWIVIASDYKKIALEGNNYEQL